MTDEVDHANELAEADRAGGVEEQLARSLLQRANALTAPDGRRHCVDCRQPIDGDRLAAVPHAIACAACESIAEQAEAKRRRAVYHRRNVWAV
jgi:RNA polymerase-binding transcription factor DksA